jgi:ABC-type transport system substrate-binding protein
MGPDRSPDSDDGKKSGSIPVPFQLALVSERLILNHSTPLAPNNGNPDYPHPILADLRVRQAIQYAIDKQDIVIDKLLYGKAKPGTTEIPSGWAAQPDVKPRIRSRKGQATA